MKDLSYTIQERIEESIYFHVMYNVPDARWSSDSNHPLLKISGDLMWSIRTSLGDPITNLMISEFLMGIWED